MLKLGKINGNLDFSEKKGSELQVEMVKNRDKGAKRASATSEAENSEKCSSA